MANVTTPIGILSFPVLFTPRPRAQGGEPCYSHEANFLYRPCCPGLTCMIAPECSGGALNGTCLR